MVKAPASHRKPWACAVGIGGEADDLPAIVDPVGRRERGAGDIDSGEALSVLQKPVESGVDIDVVADDLTARVDADALG